MYLNEDVWSGREYERVEGVMHEDNMTGVMCAVGMTDCFKLEVELDRGSTLSSFLFTMVMDILTDKMRLQYVFADYGVCSLHCGLL